MTKAEIDHLLGTIVGDWQLTEFVNAGKSAAVFRGVRGSETAAVKIFNPSLVEEFGRASQLNRILRELQLREHDHPNLVKIFDGGECKKTGRLFLVMEFIDAPDLASVITQVPRERIRPIIAQVAGAARYLLEDRDTVHRDIKPDNIAVDAEFSKATLLDLGVIRPLDISALAESSDGQRQSFLGTMRYSPPEYMFRQEKQDKDGYRAITFYQLGAVLYDLINRERLFTAFEMPKARLVKAVEQEMPTIQQPDVPQDLILLARNCLLKNPEHRLRFVTWEDFEQTTTVEPSSGARLRVMRRFASSLESTTIVSEPKASTTWTIHRAVTNVQQRITGVLKAACSAQKMFPRTTMTELPSFEEAPSANVLLVFEATPSLDIDKPVGVWVSAELIGTDPESIEVTMRALVGYDDSPEDLKSLRGLQGFSVFQGVVDEAVLTTSFEDALFRVIDFAQALEAQADRVDVNLEDRI